jgi:hypothetical protein
MRPCVVSCRNAPHQRIENPLQRLRALIEHALDALAVHQQLADSPSLHTFGIALRQPVCPPMPPRLASQSNSREGIIEPPGCHPVHHQFFHVVGAAGWLDSFASGQQVIPL